MLLEDYVHKDVVNICVVYTLPNMNEIHEKRDICLTELKFVILHHHYIIRWKDIL